MRCFELLNVERLIKVVFLHSRLSLRESNDQRNFRGAKGDDFLDACGFN